MKLAKRYDPATVEGKWQKYWEEKGTFRFSFEDDRPVYAIDTPPPTVSGDLHLGHCYSYSQTEFMARFWRMNGYNVYYPMGWDDNGLPTERLVEQRLGIKPAQVGREQFIEAIEQVSQKLEREYERLWRRLSLSVDWRYVYSTHSPEARRASQYSFIDLFNQGAAYRASAPTIWCPVCGTAIAQAEVDDMERTTNFVTIAFMLDDGQALPIATTRPELIPACVAVFVHPGDSRYSQMIGRTATTPLFGAEVPIKADPHADPEKGTGIVMCCTFGDTTDIEWWYTHQLPLISVIDRTGRLAEPAGPYSGLTVGEARDRIVHDLASQDLLLDQQQTIQTVRIHDRCDTPVEYIETKQWFIRLLDHREEFLQAGRDIHWHPPYMRARYEDWVQNLAWDWCISRQRYYGVPFPVWYCADCGETILASVSELPIDPLTQQPSRPCVCGSTEVVPEEDVMDTWATSSVSPQIAGRWLEDDELFRRVFPMSLRPNAHEIIRTWDFYTIVKSFYHFGQLPWSNIAISGFGLAPGGTGKISKSRGGGPVDPFEAMDRYSADAIRYWAASTALGRDSVINEEKFADGGRLVIKLWNVARFALRFLEGYQPPQAVPDLLPSDRWLLASLQRVIQRATDSFRDYDYASAKSEVESFFWHTLADNYLEMAKFRLYNSERGDYRLEAAKYALHTALLAVVKMLAPIMPHIAEEIYHCGFAQYEGISSIHISSWPAAAPELADDAAAAVGEALVGIATEVRRYKTVNRLHMSAPLARLELSAGDQELLSELRSSELDIRSVTRAGGISFNDQPHTQATPVSGIEGLWMRIEE